MEPSREVRSERGWLIALFGVALPAIAIAVEVLSHLCADTLFDPLPTIGHVFVALAVPVTNAFTLGAVLRREGNRLDALELAQGFVLAVSIVYGLTFLPLLPLSMFAILFFGLGILGLTPILCVIGSWRGLRALKRLRASLGRPPRRLGWAGMAAGVIVLVALQLPTATTRLLIAVAASDDPVTSRAGIRWLRRVGQRDLLLRSCYQRATAATDLVSAAVNLFAPVPPEDVRRIYYLVTGRPFDTEPRPRLGRASRMLEEDERDVGQAGAQVGVVPLRSLTLTSSRFEGSMDGRAALGYLEWTFELRNDSMAQREARAEMALPAGAVISRVTLWVDGQEREATVAARDVTRRAYQRVVRARRDPILVTTSAPDRILVQMFPVPPQGGVMKARLGITVPLRPVMPTAGRLGLPYFTQRNFSVPANVAHEVRIASKDRLAMESAVLTIAPVAGGGQEIRGRLTEPEWPGPLASVTVMRPAGVTEAWARDPVPGEGARPGEAIVVQRLRPEPLPRPDRLVVVIDGSAAMEAAARRTIGAALSAVPEGWRVAVLLAGDEVHDLLGGVVTYDEAARERAVGALRQLPFAGGVDSLPALTAAWDRAVDGGGSGRTAVLWIHGPQAMVLGNPEVLRQRAQGRAEIPAIYAFAAVGGENRLLSELANLPRLSAVERMSAGHGGPEEDVARFLRLLNGAEERLVAVRTRETTATAAGAQTSDHLARLWARDRIEELLRPGATGSGQQGEALALAARYGLVTPVSGAVVLETAAQYQQAGLAPGPSSPVPTVPEPETWALLALVIAILAMVAARRWRLAGAPRRAL
jgi:hypothetical protein